MDHNNKDAMRCTPVVAIVSNNAAITRVVEGCFWCSRTCGIEMDAASSRMWARRF